MSQTKDEIVEEFIFVQYKIANSWVRGYFHDWRNISWKWQGLHMSKYLAIKRIDFNNYDETVFEKIRQIL
jgi:hypothetical protein